MRSENIEAILLTKDDLLFTSCRLRFEESSVGLSAASGLEELRTLLRRNGAGVIILDCVQARETLGLGPEEAVRKIASILPSRILIALTEDGDPPERVVRLLELGAHDTVQKPVKPRILAEQVKALVRVFAKRAGRARSVYSSPGAALVMDYPRRTCYAREPGGGRRVLKLTRAEFRVLHLLLQKNGAVATYEDFRDAIWPDAASYREISHVLHQLVTNIRAKMAGSPARIENLRAEGFRLVQNEP